MKLTRAYLINYIRQNISSYKLTDMSKFSDGQLIELFEKGKKHKREAAQKKKDET